MHNSDKSNEIYSQYIEKELLDALEVFLKSSDNDEVTKNAMVVAKEFGGSKDVALLISGNDTEKSESEETGRITEKQKNEIEEYTIREDVKENKQKLIKKLHMQYLCSRIHP